MLSHFRSVRLPFFDSQAGIEPASPVAFLREARLEGG